MNHYRHWQYIKRTLIDYSLSLEGLLQISAFTDYFKVLLNFLDITCRRFCYIYSSYSVIFCKEQFKKKGKNHFAVKHTNGQICKPVLFCIGIKHSQSPAFICDSSTPIVETINPVPDTLSIFTASVMSASHILEILYLYQGPAYYSPKDRCCLL